MKTWSNAEKVDLSLEALKVSKCSFKWLKFWSLHFKIYEELAIDPLSKVSELSKSNNFSSGRFWSYMKEIGENLNGNSQIQNITKFQNFPKIPQCSEACNSKTIEN